MDIISCILRLYLMLLLLPPSDQISANTDNADNGNDDRHPKHNRFLTDPQQNFVSERQRIACSTTCIDKYVNLTRQCCSTGNNKDCYLVPVDILKPYIGSCLTQATAIAASTTTHKVPYTVPTTPRQTTAVAALTTSHNVPYTIPHTARQTTAAAAQTTTHKVPYTIPPKTTNCAKSAGPEIQCENLYQIQPCEYPDNYCINTIVNHADGTRRVIRGCGNFDTCYKDWFLGSSDIDKCRLFDENRILTLKFDCTFCCIKDGCNVPLRPASDTMYKDL